MSAETTKVPQDGELLDAMREIIRGSDLENLSFRVVMTVLEGKFGNLDSRRPFLKEQINIIVNEVAAENEGASKGEDGPKEEPQQPEVRSKKQESSDDQSEEEPETKTTAKPKTKVKTQSKPGTKKQDEENSDNSEHEDEKIVIDGVELDEDGLEAQRQLYESIQSGETPGRRPTRAAAKNAKRPRPVPKKRKSDDGEDGDEPKKKKAKRPPKLKQLTPKLAELMGATEMTRTDVVKKLHEYIKEHNLHNPANRRQILLDDKLQAIFKKARTDCFKINTLLSAHLYDKHEA